MDEFEWIDIDLNETDGDNDIQSGGQPPEGPDRKPDEEPGKKGKKGKKGKDLKDDLTTPLKLVRFVFSVAVMCAAVFLATLILSKFVLFNAYIPSASMCHTLEVEDRLFGLRMAYLFSEPERGDIVIFEHTCYEGDEEETLIKRIIGLPGDEIYIEDGTLYINDEVYEENYLAEDMVGSYGPYTVPEGCYFMMGDNRNISDDSRLWDYPYVEKDEIIARAWLKYKPSFKLIK